MNLKIMTVILVLSVLVSACSPTISQALGEGESENDPAAKPLIGADPQSNAPGSAIENDGTVYSVEPANSEPGNAAGSQPSSQNRGNKKNMQWLPYTDPVFGFSLNYPDIYTPLKEPANLSEIDAALIGRMRLLEPALAASEVADLEPPKFSIEVFSNAARASLTDWIETTMPGGSLANIVIDGVTCTKVTLAALMAPNQFIFCEYGGNFYRFIPSGPQSQEILKTFKFGSQ